MDRLRNIARFIWAELLSDSDGSGRHRELRASVVSTVVACVVTVLLLLRWRA